jgi:hypothetical protein
MKLDIEKLDFKKTTDNIYKVFHDNKILKFWSPVMLAPFGIDNDYGKYILKLEFNPKDENSLEQDHFEKVIQYIEKLICKKLELQDKEWKSIIRHREKKEPIIELRLKNFKNNLQTEIEYMDKENNYLKTAMDLSKMSKIKVQLEVNGLWDYRDENSEKKEFNKVGLIVYVNKIIVI